MYKKENKVVREARYTRFARSECSHACKRTILYIILLLGVIQYTSCDGYTRCYTRAIYDVSLRLDNDACDGVKKKIKNK